MLKKKCVFRCIGKDKTKQKLYIVNDADSTWSSVSLSLLHSTWQILSHCVNVTSLLEANGKKRMKKQNAKCSKTVHCRLACTVVDTLSGNTVVTLIQCEYNSNQCLKGTVKNIYKNRKEIFDTIKGEKWVLCVDSVLTHRRPAFRPRHNRKAWAPSNRPMSSRSIPQALMGFANSHRDCIW